MKRMRGGAELQEEGDPTNPQAVVAEGDVNGIYVAELHPDVLIDIAGRLTTGLDHLAFSSVCRLWRRCCQPLKSLVSPFLPVKVPPPYDLPSPSFSQSLADCVVSAGAVFLLRAPMDAACTSQSAGCFLLFASEFVQRKFWLRNPLSRSMVSELHYHMPSMLNLLDFHALEIGRYYSLCSVPFNYKSMPPFKYFNNILKVVLISDGSRAVVLFQSGKLALINFAEGKCHHLKYSSAFKVDDVAELGGKVYVVNRNGCLFVVEDDTRFSLSRVAALQFLFGARRKRIVISSGALYLVFSSLVVGPEGGTSFMVCKLKFDECLWERVTNLGDEMLFVGQDLSFSIPTQGVAESCHKNCILWTEDSFPFYHDMEHPPHQKAAEDGLELRLFCIDDGGNRALEGSLSGILWPPPSWLLSRSEQAA